MTFAAALVVIGALRAGDRRRARPTRSPNGLAADAEVTAAAIDDLLGTRARSPTTS